MSIKYKANLTQQLSQLDNVVAKYSDPYRHRQPSTPEFINGPPNFTDLTALRDTKTNLSNNMAGLKQQNIKSLDDRINSIMKKHEKREEDPGINLNLDRDRKEANYETNTLRSIIRQPNRKESLQQKELGAAKTYSTNGQEIKEECRRIRERSMIIFEEKSQAKKGNSVNPERRESKENKYDAEIEKLNERIRVAEEKKKKYNIEFSPFSQQINKSNPQKSRKSSINQQLISKLESMKENTATIHRQTPQQPLTQIMSVQPKGCIRHQKSSFICEPFITPTKITDFNLKNSYIDSSHKTQQPTKTSTISQIVEAFIQQIKLDEQLRNLKIWFTFSNQKNKWDSLWAEVTRKNISVGKSQLRSVFESGIEEHNPFFRWEGTTFQAGLQSLLQAYQKSQRHWLTKVVKGWPQSELQGINLKKALLYDDRSQAIAIQDLVRFINMQKDAFYRNRDLFLIYRRLWSKTTNKVEYSSLLRTLCR